MHTSSRRRLTFGLISPASLLAVACSSGNGDAISTLEEPEQEVDAEPELAAVAPQPPEPQQAQPAAIGAWAFAQTLEPYAEAVRFGGSIAQHRGLVAIGAPAVAQDADLAWVYLFARDGDGEWALDAELRAPGASAEGFGTAVAVSDDTLIVGAPLADLAQAPHAGAAYVFERGGDGWQLTGALEPPQPEAWQAFGAAVAVHQDRVVVGSLDRDQGTVVDAGAAYVFERRDGRFALLASLSAPAPVASDKFGHAVAILDDRVVVGALQRDLAPASDAGAVFVFQRADAHFPTENGQPFGLRQTLSAPVPASLDHFGKSLALVHGSDLNQRLLVGAPQADVEARSDAGAAFVFEAAPAGDFVETQQLAAAAPASGAGFGDHVALDRDWVLIGSERSTPDAAADLFARSAQGFRHQALLAAPQTDAMSSGPVALGTGAAFLGALPRDAGLAERALGAVQVFRCDPP